MVSQPRFRFGRLTWLVLLFLLLPAAPGLAEETPPEQPPAKDSFSFSKFYFGGGLGFSVGDVTYFEVSPLVGYRAKPRLDVGVSLLFRYREDDRFADDMTTRDYGGSLFTRYRLLRGLFLHGEYEYLDYEYPRPDSSTDHETYHSLFGGIGMSRPTGRRGSVFLLALYNFTYSDDERSPYSDPWTIRVGGSVGF